MQQETRNNAVGGLVVLVGALLIGVGAAQPWLRADTSLLDQFGLSGNYAFGFDDVPISDDGAVTLRGLLIGAAVVVAVLALALTATRVRRLGVAWRLGMLVVLALLGVFVVLMWRWANDPAQAVEDADPSAIGQGTSILVSLSEQVGAVDYAPGLGLWFVTGGTVLALAGVFIPATRRRAPQPSAPGVPQGWYPDPGNPATLRWFDGSRWTDHTRPTG